MTTPPMFGSDATAVLQTATTPPGRIGKSVQTYDYKSWHDQVLHIESSKDPLLNFYDPSDELELRSNGNSGTSIVSRPAASVPTPIWPNTLGAGKTFRQFYTTTSFDRDLRRYGDPVTPVVVGQPPYKLLSDNDTTELPLWPTAPQKVAINANLTLAAPVSVPNLSTMGTQLAKMATNLGSAMELSGYTHDEAVAAAANFLTYRYSGASLRKTGVPYPVYSVPGGPSFIDDQGICIRGSDQNNAPAAVYDTTANSTVFGGGVARALKAKAGTVVLGYVAQPFINEVAASMYTTTVPGPPPVTTLVITAGAVEIYNPYPVPLSLEGFRLVRGAGLAPVKTFGADDYIPANVAGNKPYVVVVKDAADDIGKTVTANVTLGPVVVAAGTDVIDLTQSPGPMLLQRHFYDRGGAEKWVTIDTFAYTGANPGTGNDLLDTTGVSETVPTAPGIYSVQRPNGVLGTMNGPTVTAYSTGATVEINTRIRAYAELGAVNTHQAGGPAAFVPLLDRFADTATTSFNAPARNIGDFLNGVMRRAIVYSTVATDAVDFPTYLGKLLTTALPAPFASMTSAPYDSMVHFNITTPATSIRAPRTGILDPSAVALFDYLAWIDRVS
ncbi:MAG: hypothetical protein WCI73_18090, partial [Phycisphaerae bacterium]